MIWFKQSSWNYYLQPCKDTSPPLIQGETPSFLQRHVITVPYFSELFLLNLIHKECLSCINHKWLLETNAEGNWHNDTFVELFLTTFIYHV